uniref:Uncharacterized protein n=1 Tax=Strigamia maritima TaxID=126957 RepID=T1IX40_STRMM
NLERWQSLAVFTRPFNYPLSQNSSSGCRKVINRLAHFLITKSLFPHTTNSNNYNCFIYCSPSLKFYCDILLGVFKKYKVTKCELAIKMKLNQNIVIGFFVTCSLITFCLYAYTSSTINAIISPTSCPHMSTHYDNAVLSIKNILSIMEKNPDHYNKEITLKLSEAVRILTIEITSESNNIHAADVNNGTLIKSVNSSLKDSATTSHTLYACPEKFLHAKYGDPYFMSGSWQTEDCGSIKPISEILTVIFLTSEDNPCSEKENKLMIKFLNLYPQLPILIGASEKSVCTAHNDNINVVKFSSRTKLGDKLNSLIFEVKTPLTLITRNLDDFNWLARLERQLSVFSIEPSAIIVGGSIRNKTGHWQAGCYQTEIRQYILKYTEGYYKSKHECMYCDHLIGPFIAKSKYLKVHKFNENMDDDVVYEDFFLNIKQSDESRLILACPDVMYHSTDPWAELRTSQRKTWFSLSAKWKLNRIILPDGTIHKFSCAESNLDCKGLARQVGAMMMPLCCRDALINGYKVFHEFSVKHGVMYQIEGGSALGAVKLNDIIPWDFDGDGSYYKDKMELFAKEMNWTNSDGEIYVDHIKFKATGFFYVSTPHAFIEFWAVPKLSLDASNLTDLFHETPTLIRIGDAWVYAPPSPGLYARNYYGNEMLRHSNSYYHLGRGHWYSPYNMKLNKKIVIAFVLFCIVIANCLYMYKFGTGNSVNLSPSYSPQMSSLCDTAVLNLNNILSIMKKHPKCYNKEIALKLSETVRILTVQGKDAAAASSKVACPEKFLDAEYADPYFLSGSWVTEDCGPLKHISKILTVVYITSKDNSCSKSENKRMLKILKLHPQLSIVLGAPKKSDCTAHKYNITIVKYPSKSKLGGKLNRLISAVKTPLTLITRNLDDFNWLARLERQLRVFSIEPSAIIVGGSVRNKTGHWRAGCYQTELRQYILKYIEGYYESKHECMYCDHLIGPFIAKSKYLKIHKFNENMDDDVVFEDFFLNIKQSKFGRILACPDVMYHSTDPGTELRTSQQKTWFSLSAKWKLNRIVLPDGTIHKFSCAESKLDCKVLARQNGAMVMPICCRDALINGYKVFHEFSVKHHVIYQIDGGSALGAVKLNDIIPWDFDGDGSYYKDKMELFAKEMNWTNSDGEIYVDHIKFKAEGFFYVSTPQAKIEFWAVPKLSLDASNLTDLFHETPTLIRIGDAWVYAPPSPGLYARNYFGNEMLRHSNIHYHLGRGHWYSSYNVSDPFISCKVKHHACLDQFKKDGNIQFKIPNQ